jgi:hypothetical protein
MNKIAALLLGLAGLGMLLRYWIPEPDDIPASLVGGIVLLVCAAGSYFAPAIEKVLGISSDEKSRKDDSSD